MALASGALLAFALAACAHRQIAEPTAVDHPLVQVVTIDPGVSADRMAAFVTTPLEQEFLRTLELGHMSSISSHGLSAITLQLGGTSSRGADIVAVRNVVDAAVASFPADLPGRPTISVVRPGASLPAPNSAP